MKYFSILFFAVISLAQPSRIELKSHYSPTLFGNKEFNVFYPEGYDSESDRYPVVYLFRGAVDEWADPAEDGARRGNIKTVFDSLYAKKKIGKMILIMPGLNAPATQTEYTYIVNDLIPYIDSNFRTIPCRWHRTMDGFSLGGTIVTNLLASVPQLFCSAGSYDGTLNSPYFDNTLFSNASSALIYDIKQIQLLYHTGSVGGTNNSNNHAVFNILNGKGIYNSLPSFLLDPNAQHNWFYADWHVAITLPLHWQKIQSAVNRLNLALKTQLTGQSISGSTVIQWTRIIVPNSISTQIFFSNNNGKNWKAFYSTTTNDSSFQWNTVPLSDGTLYRVKIMSAGDSLFGSATSGTFTINNPGNGAPDAEFVNLNDGDTISGNYNLQWYAGDADGDALSVTLEISSNAGTTWNTIASSIANSGHYLLNSSNYSNSSSMLFRITCSDGTASSHIISPNVILYNKRVNLINASFEHQSGHSDAVLKAVGMSVESLRTANYSIIFKESSGKKTYSVFNTNGVEIVKDATELDGKTEGPLFNGFRLLIQDFPKPVVNVDSSRWIVGSSSLAGEIRLIDVVLESATVSAVPFASDYEIRINNSIADTSLAMFGAAAQPVNFYVWNTTLNHKTKFIYVEMDGNGTLSRNDELYLIEKDTLNSQQLTWHIQFVGNETATNPIAGDKFKIRIMQPLSTADRYLFIFYPPLSVKNGNTLPTDFSLSQNYPNPFNPTTTIEFAIPKNEIVTLTVFDILGRTLQTLIHQQMSAGTHKIDWNASHHSSGIYFYKIQTRQFTNTKKMILMK